MLAIYRSTNSSLARTALSIALQNVRCLSATSRVQDMPHNPLKVTVETDDLGLPLTPLLLAIPSIPKTSLTREQLVKLHRLSALNPPEEGSPEETELKDGLGELIGLMDIVKAVELPKGDLRTITAELLSDGIGEVVVDANVAQVELSSDDSQEGKDGVEKEKKGRDLLELATRRVGDYYASRVKSGV